MANSLGLPDRSDARTVVVSGSFDDLRSHHIRFLHEAAKLGDELHVLLWSDDAVYARSGRAPKFGAAERTYLLEALRYVDRVTVVAGPLEAGRLPGEGLRGMVWAVDGSAGDEPGRAAFCLEHGVEYRALTADELAGFPEPGLDRRRAAAQAGLPRKKVVVTGCYDWLHSGHVRFFEEVSQLGEVYVVVGSDANVRLLKGAGHPLFPQDERRYVVGSVRYVKQALVSTGWGWMDAEPEIALIKPDIYAVNEDGDKPEKREFCRAHGIEYAVLKRKPKEGLPRRESTALRGF